MVTVDTYIVGTDMPARQQFVKHECDRCGRRCYQDGNIMNQLYGYDGEELCFEHTWDALIADGIITVVE